jgi:hypothetical protein
MRRLLIALALLGVSLVAAQPVGAHGFGQRYDLPVPLWLYLYGAGAAVIVSFVFVGLFAGEARATGRYPTYNLLRLGWFRRLAGSRLLPGALRVLSVALFLLVLASGFFGVQAVTFNFAPTFVWIIWWVGLSYVVALVGNLWPLVNPWKITFEWADALARRLGGSGLEGLNPYPPRWGVWPALLFYVAFIWLEIAFEGAPRPRNIALLAFCYSLATWAGMIWYGKDVWLRQGEAFSVYFGLLARCAPTEVRVNDPELCATCESSCGGVDGCVNCEECFAWSEPENREINLRPWGAGLLGREPITLDRLAFVTFLLSSVTLDGLVVTSFWARLQTWALPVINLFGRYDAIFAQTVGILVVPPLFLGIYWATILLTRALTGDRERALVVAGRFVYSLIPIALAYQIAHYLSYFLIIGQLIIPLASDPFGYGWDLFGTAEYRVWVGIISARAAWYIQVAMIVLGHVAAVYLAHTIALRDAPERRKALRGQYPLLALMVLYTISSLWILSQPVVSEEEARTTSGADPPAVRGHAGGAGAGTGIGESLAGITLAERERP